MSDFDGAINDRVLKKRNVIQYLCKKKIRFIFTSKKKINTM